jgi:hypothetical protein
MTTTINKLNAFAENCRNLGVFGQPLEERIEVPAIRLEKLLVDNEQIDVVTDVAEVVVSKIKVKDHGYSEASVTFTGGRLSNANGTTTLPHNEPLTGEFPWDYSIRPGDAFEFNLVDARFRGALVKLGAVATIRLVPKT